MSKPMTKVLIFGGKTGWIGGQMNELCEKEGVLDWTSVTKERISTNKSSCSPPLFYYHLIYHNNRH
jgi:hypothetical protein